MRLATFNILHGRSLADGVVAPERLADAVRRIDADVLGLQEVDRDQPRSHRLDLAAVAAEAMGAVTYRFAPAMLGTPGGDWQAAQGDETVGPAYGVALCSRHPVLSWQVTRLPPLPTPAAVRRRPSGRWLRDEPRVALTAAVDAPGGPLTVTVTHLSFLFGWNVAQLLVLRRRQRSPDGPRVLLGDFNLPGRLPAALAGLRDLVAAKTFPRDAPDRQIDHLLGSLDVVASGALALPVSDHRALYADVVR